MQILPIFFETREAIKKKKSPLMIQKSDGCKQIINKRKEKKKNVDYYADDFSDHKDER